MQKFSSLAPYLASYRKGIVVADAEFAFSPEQFRASLEGAERGERGLRGEEGQELSRDVGARER